jgi:hypothetical protein
VHKDVTLQLNQVLTVDAVLQMGQRTEVVEVTSEAPLVDTTSTQLGAVVNERAVTGLPLSSRDTYQLLQLQPGVTSIGGTDLFFGSDTAGAVSVNGGRGRTNNFMVNGGDGNDLFVNAPAIQPSPDSIQEFRVLTNTMDAEYGRNSGSVVNVVTKSGTNQWHGSVFEFFRNDALNARGFFDPARPALKQNEFGGTFGGPIKRDRTFLFVSYEGRRNTQGFTTDPAVVPTAAERTGDFSQSPFFPGFLGPVAPGTCPTDSTAVVNCPPASITDQTVADVLNTRCGIGAAAGQAWNAVFPGSIIPAACLDPVAVDLLRFVNCPLADSTCTNLANLANNFQAIPIGHTRDDQVTVRLDHHINQNQNLSIYYYLQTGPSDRPFSHFESATPNVLPGFGTISATRNQQLNASHTWTLNPTMVNEFRFTYFRAAQGTFMHPQHTNLVTDSCTAAAAAFCFTGATDTPTSLGGPITTVTGPGGIGITPNLGAGREGVPFITISGGFTIGNNFEGEIPQIGQTFQWSDNLTKVWGKHTAKFGVDFRHQKFDQTLYFDVNGDYGYTGGGQNDPLATRNSDGTQNLFPNYLLGLPDSYLQGSAQDSKYRTNSLYLYAQDSWKIKPNLTLNYGLRWELNTPFADDLHRVQTFRPGQATTTYPCQLSAASQAALGYATTDCNPGGSADAVFPLGLVVKGDTGVPNGLTSTYHRSFAPRVGIAWSPGKSGKTSIHAGFGIFYNPIEQLVLEQLGAQPPFGGSTFVGENFFQAPFVLQSCTAPCSAATGGVVPNPFDGILSPAPGTATDWSRFRPILLFGQVPSRLRSQYTEQYNVSVERELTKSLVLHVGYVGSQGHRLLGTHDLNFGNPQTCVDLHDMSVLNADPNIDCGQFFADSSFTIPAGYVLPPGGLHLPYGSTPVVTGAATANQITLVGLRRYSSPLCEPMTGAHCPLDGLPVFSSIFSQDTVASSSYHSLQASLEKRFSKGLQFEAAYTYSSARDNVSTFEELLNPLCFKCGWAPSLFDARHRFVFSYYWELPIPKYEGGKRVLLNGWAVSGITTFQSGFPIRILSSDDQELQFSFDFNLPGRPDLLGPFRTFDPRKNGGYAFDTSAFTTAAFGTAGTAPRSICCGAGVYNSDFSLQKDTKLGERVNMQFRSEFFNLFNTTQFLNPDGNITDGSDFGRVKRARTPRQIQFALKFSF